MSAVSLFKAYMRPGSDLYKERNSENARHVCAARAATVIALAVTD